MPCNCDHLEPNAHEAESKRVAILLIYANDRLGRVTPAWVRKAADDCYGAPSQVHDLTERLCTLCTGLTKSQADTVIYDGRNAQARDLANWWDDHQKADAAKAREEQAAAARAKVKQKALAKLNPTERRALGLKD